MTDTATPEGGGGTEPCEAAFFDLDKTVIAKAAMTAFRGPLYHGGLLTRRSLIHALFAKLVYLHLGASERRLSRMREVLLKVTRGWQRSEVMAIVDETLEGIIEPIIYAEALDLIDQHRAEGRLVALVSASPEEIVAPLGRHLGVDAVIASRAEVDAEDRYTGQMAFYAYGPYKAEAVREFAEQRGVDLAHSFAYSDSYTDLPMLEAVGIPVAVNPDRVLASLARERGWEIRHFVRPVRLRDQLRERVPVPESPTIVVALGMALALGAIALGWIVGARRPRVTVAPRAGTARRRA